MRRHGPNGSRLRESTVRALPALLELLAARGLACVTLSALVDGREARVREPAPEVSPVGEDEIVEIVDADAPRRATSSRGR